MPMAARLSPRTPQDYRDRANACERQAEAATNPQTREILLYLAKRWRDLASRTKPKSKTERSAIRWLIDREEALSVKTADELREEAARIREFAPWVRDEEVVTEILALAEELERRAHSLMRDAADD
jgi:hypothetical protein